MVGDDSTDERSYSRREFLEWASAVGLAAVAPTTVADIAEARERREKPDPVPQARRGDPTDDVVLEHHTEFRHVQDALERAVATNDPSVLLDRKLTRRYEQASSESTVDVIVRTIGDRSVVETNRRGRTIEGWSPTDAEVERLRQFGDVVYVSRFLTPKVVVEDVAVDRLAEIAQSEFVTGVTEATDGGDEDHIPISDFRTTSYAWYDSADYSVASDVRVGIIDRGYEGGGASSYGESLAEDQIDTSLANDFTNAETGWDDPANTHGDNVTDTIAYCLQDGHSDLYVPLKINYDSTDNWSANISAAIEYATENDIEVINMSQGDYAKGHCTEQFCGELYGYSASGFIPVASTGNGSSSSGASEPGNSALSINVGGINSNECSGDEDYERYDSSNYGEIDYSDCGWCKAVVSSPYREHVPDVYGAHRIRTDANGYLSGTSFAAPTVAASAIIMQSNGLYDFHEAESIFHDMSYHDVCPPEAAEEGQLVDAWLANYRTE